MEKTSACGSMNHAYFLGLIDWGRVLDSDELKKVTARIVGSSAPTSDGWKVKPLHWPEIGDIISNVELGFYHSRLIFKFDLKSTPNDIIHIRDLREKLQCRLEDFCVKKVIPVIRSFMEDAEEPFIFLYPIFELNTQEDFWRFKREKPYSLPTTCFFTELDDRRGLPFFGKKVQMRISGAKIIASDMSSWFFENLVSIVFHEGLYRQTRDKKEGKLSNAQEVYKGLENRLEDFAGRLMTTFHEYSSEYVRRNISKFALLASGIAIILTIINLTLNILQIMKIL